MAKNTTQAEVVVTLNGQAARNELNRIEKEMQQYRDAAEEAYRAGNKALGDQMTKNAQRLEKEFKVAKKEMKDFSDTVKNMGTKSIKELEAAAKGLEKQLKTLSRKDPSWDQKKKQYQQVTRQLKEMKAEYKGVNAEQEKSKEGLGKLTSALGKYSAYIAAAMAALKAIIYVTKETINASQTMGDAWNNSITAMKTTTQAFWAALSTGDWTVFNDGINAALKRAKELAEIMDLIGSYGISKGYMQSKYMVEYQQAMTQARNKNLSEEQRQEWFKIAEDRLREYNEFLADEGEKNQEALRKSFETLKGLTFDTQEEFEAFLDRLYKNAFVGRDKEFEKAKKDFDKWKAEFRSEELIEEDPFGSMVIGFDPSSGSSFDAAFGTLATMVENESEAVSKAYEKVEKQYGHMIRQLIAATEITDEEHQKLIKLYSDHQQSLQQVAKSERQLNEVRAQLKVDAGEYAKAVKEIDEEEMNAMRDTKKRYADGLVDKTTYEKETSRIGAEAREKRKQANQRYLNEDLKAITTNAQTKTNETKKEYEQGKISYEEYQETLTKITIAANEERNDIIKFYNEELRKIEDKDWEERIKERERRLQEWNKAYTNAQDRVSKSEQERIKFWKKQYAAGIIDKTTYETRIALTEEEYLQRRMATAQRYGKDTDQYMSQLLDRQISRLEWAKAQMKEEMDELQKYYDNLQKGEENRFGSTSYDDKASEQFWGEIAQKAADIRAQITDESARQEYDTKVAWAKKLAEKEILTNKEAQKYILQAKIDYAAKAAETVDSLMQQSSDFVAALKEAETAKLEAEYQKQLTAAGDNAERREKIEADYEQKKLELSKKYADTEMVINIAKTIAAGALAAIQAFAQLGPIAGAVAAVLIAGITTAEVATIIAQRNAIKNSSVSSSGSSSAANSGTRVLSGYSTGGYTDQAASDHKAVGVVHANEWVAPAWMVRSNPVTFANLESYRKSGSHGRTGSAAKGFADGSYTGQQGGVEIYPADVEALVYAAISRAMADGTIRANVVYQDLKSKENQLGRFNAQTSR